MKMCVGPPDASVMFSLFGLLAPYKFWRERVERHMKTTLSGYEQAPLQDNVDAKKKQYNKIKQQVTEVNTKRGIKIKYQRAHSCPGTVCFIVRPRQLFMVF